MVAKIQKGSISLDYETDPLLRHKSSKSKGGDDSSGQGQSDSIRRLAMSAAALQKVCFTVILQNLRSSSLLMLPQAKTLTFATSSLVFKGSKP